MSQVQKCSHEAVAEAVEGAKILNSPRRISGSKSYQNNLCERKHGGGGGGGGLNMKI